MADAGKDARSSMSAHPDDGREVNRIVTTLPSISSSPAQPPLPSAKLGAAPRRWPQWALLAVFAFLALECLLLAAALQGTWLMLIAPGAVCGYKAHGMWRELRKP